MCGLYGVLSYGNKIKDIEGITEALAVESAVRGTDATGIAYNYHGKLNIFKRSKSAYVINFDVPENTAAVMGHTRNATQGTLKFNGNNHPFRGKCGKTTFALAHNGILCNDRILRRRLNLPKTKIETDSYIGPLTATAEMRERKCLMWCLPYCVLITYSYLPPNTSSASRFPIS